MKKTKNTDRNDETDTQQNLEAASLTVNAPFRGKQFAANKKLTPEEIAILENALPEEEQLQFAVVGDLSVKNRYARSLLAVTDQKIYGLDENFEGGVKTHDFANVKRAWVKRCYGNALLIFSGEDESRVNFLRFSYREAPIFDAAASYITRIAGGANREEERHIIEASFEKRFRVCPKCGRTLIRPGAPCMNCQSKDKVIQKLGRYILPYKGVLAICLLLAVATTAVSLVPPYMTKVLVDSVLPNGDKNGLLQCVLVLLLSHLVHYGIGAVRSHNMRVVGDRIMTDIRNDVYAKAQKLQMRFYDRTSTGSVINRISGDSQTINSFMMRVTQEVVVQLFLMIGIIFIMLAMNWQLTLLALIPVPFVVYGSRVFGKKVRPYYRRSWRHWAAVTSIMTDTIPGIRVIKAFASEKRSVEKFTKANRNWLQNDIRASRIITLFPNIVGFAIHIGSLLIWGVGGIWVIDKPEFISAGLLVSFISYASMFYGPVNFFANFNDSYQGFLNAAERLMDIIDAEPENDFSGGKHPEKFKGKIEFRNVNFSFDRAKKTLTNINFVIEPGDVVGIVGTTGAGKSTLINLLMRYYDHYDGEILVDDINIRDIDMTFYRSELGYVQQEPMMFHDTIFQNIAYGCENATVEDVIHAADVANAHAFIARLPDGYDTVLGERGVGLSGGERQRLSIARAVLKNPNILLFDEATASVDSETEHQIQEAIEQMIQGRTTLMIAHRLSTLRKANKIIVVDKGKILEMGTPEELMALKGKYYKLIQIQTMSAEIQKTKEEERL